MAAARRTGTPSVEVDVKLIAQLRPDVILGQSLCEVCAVGESGLGQLVAALNPTPWVVMLHAHTLDGVRSEEHTSELQSRLHLVCRLLLEKKNKNHLTTAY